MVNCKREADLLAALPEKNSIIRGDLIELIDRFKHAAMLKNKTILVSGGGGFLPSFLIKALLSLSHAENLGIKVICVARKYESVQARLCDWVSNPDLTIFIHDVSNPLPGNFPPAEIIIHAASQASPKFYGVDPVGTIEANTIGTSQLLKHAIKCQAEKFLYFSSGEVYGVPLNDESKLSETDFGYLDPMNVRACYAESKRVAETMCVAWAKQFGLNASIVRPFHTYGPGMALDDGRVFADFVADVVNQRDISIKSDGLAMRPFCYITDATIGFLMVLLFGGTAEAYNVGNPDAEISIGDLAKLLAGLYPEKGIKVKYECDLSNSSYLKSPVTRSCLSIEKIRKLQWEPRINLEVGFKRTVDSYL